MNEEQLRNWFTYHAPSTEQLPKYLAVREAVMTANQAIACGGK